MGRPPAHIDEGREFRRADTGYTKASYAAVPRCIGPDGSRHIHRSRQMDVGSVLARYHMSEFTRIYRYIQDLIPDLTR